MKRYEVQFNVIDRKAFIDEIREVVTRKKEYFRVDDSEFTVVEGSIRINADTLEEAEKKFYEDCVYKNTEKYIAIVSTVRRIDGRKNAEGKTVEEDIEFSLRCMLSARAMYYSEGEKLEDMLDYFLAQDKKNCGYTA